MVKGGKKIKDLFYLLRPAHWVKNLLVVAPPFFAGVVFNSLESFITAFIAFLSFSFASSVGYIFNDLFDVKQDINHPIKKERPIASGRVNKKYAVFLGTLLLALSIILAVWINLPFTVFVVSYLVLTTSYTLGLKNVVILESFCIAGGFLLRIVAGGAAFGIDISGWLILTTLFLSLLLAFGKRRSELNMTNVESSFRKVLEKYDKSFLDYMLVLFSTASIITYSMYLIDKGFGLLLITIPFVCFGVIRYMYLARTKSKGDPTEALLKDFWLLLCVVSWLVIKGIAIYTVSI